MRAHAAYGPLAGEPPVRSRDARLRSCSADELYDVLDMTYAASLGRISKCVQLGQSLPAHLEQSNGDVADIAPNERLGELLRKISAYTDHSSGAARCQPVVLDDPYRIIAIG
jgi:hypothetical protein